MNVQEMIKDMQTDVGLQMQMRKSLLEDEKAFANVEEQFKGMVRLLRPVCRSASEFKDRLKREVFAEMSFVIEFLESPDIPPCVTEGIDTASVLQNVKLFNKLVEEYEGD